MLRCSLCGFLLACTQLCIPPANALTKFSALQQTEFLQRHTHGTASAGQSSGGLSSLIARASWIGGSSSTESTNTDAPSVFVAIFSAQGNTYRRYFARQALKGASDSFTAKFVVCNNATNKVLQAEMERREDMLLIECTEGVERTLLPMKMLETMKQFKTQYPEKKLFMKVDDDTFVAWRKLSQFLQELSSGGKLNSFVYMGVAKPAGLPVNRNPDSIWYQPHAQYPNSTWPLYMAAGSGYILGGSLVHHILDNKIAETNLLSNEDQSVGVWVNQVRQSGGEGVDVRILEIPGTSACSDARACAGSWKDYPYILHHRLKGEFIECLSKFDASEAVGGNIDSCFIDTIFVAVFSRRDLASAARRVLLRDMLANANTGLSTGKVLTKFVLCNPKEGGANADSVRLEAEAKENGDMLLLPCEEGYTRTLLTKKLTLAMEAYHEDYMHYSLFMKVDDDTFVSWKRLAAYVSTQFGSEFMYMGIPCPEGREVNRNVTSLWYQPESDYVGRTYPSTMEGGPGYLLGNELVRRILEDGVAGRFVLSNEDQAAGVWVDELRKVGVPALYTSIPGTDGYKPSFDICSGTWKNYPYMLHHKLDATTISCLAKIDAADDDTLTIEDCFQDCQQQTANRLDDSLVRLGDEVHDTMEKLETMSREMGSLSTSLKWLLTKTAKQNVAGDMILAREPAEQVHESFSPALFFSPAPPPPST